MHVNLGGCGRSRSSIPFKDDCSSSRRIPGDKTRHDGGVAIHLKYLQQSPEASLLMHRTMQQIDHAQTARTHCSEPTGRAPLQFQPRSQCYHASMLVNMQGRRNTRSIAYCFFLSSRHASTHQQTLESELQLLSDLSQISLTCHSLGYKRPCYNSFLVGSRFQPRSQQRPRYRAAQSRTRDVRT